MGLQGLGIRCSASCFRSPYFGELKLTVPRCNKGWDTIGHAQQVTHFRRPTVCFDWIGVAASIYFGIDTCWNSSLCCSEDALQHCDFEHMRVAICFTFTACNGKALHACFRGTHVPEIVMVLSLRDQVLRYLQGMK